MSTGALMKKARAFEAAKAVRNRAPRIRGAIAAYGGRQELKYTDLAAATYVGDSTGTVTALNLIAVGDDNTTRDGRQVCIKSVQVRGHVFPTDNTVQNNLARMLLVWDNAVNSGALPTIATMLTAANAVSFPSVDQAQRFTILADMQFAIGAVSDVATQAFAASPNVYSINVYKKLNHIVQYSGTTAAIGSIQNGGLYLVTIGTAAANAGSTFQLATRVRFTDQ